MKQERQIFIPVILGTTRKGRASENVARFVHGELSKHEDVETVLVDVRDIKLPLDDAGEAIKDSGFSQLVSRADGLLIVTPEYNHGYPGMLKHLLDTNLKEYIHKAVGVCGVSAGGFGGTRVIENLLPVLRELGLVTIFSDGNFSNAQKLFDKEGKILDEAYTQRVDKLLQELIWMSKVLRCGREEERIKKKEQPVICPDCGAEMNHHADKINYSAALDSDAGAVDPVFGGVVEEAHTCPSCGRTVVRPAPTSEE